MLRLDDLESLDAREELLDAGGGLVLPQPNFGYLMELPVKGDQSWRELHFVSAT